MVLAAVDIEKDELRKKTLEIVKRHKASWIELGQYLYTVHKEKLYKTWGFLSFEAYCKKELGLKETTASKLLKSYFFLEKEEPRIAAPSYAEETEPRTIPNYESVNLLRLAKENKKISSTDYADLRHEVLNTGKEPKEIRAQVTKMIAEQEEAKNPSEVRRTKRNTAIKRLVTMLNLTKREFESEHLLPAYLLKQMNDLTEKLVDQLEEK